MLAVEDGQQGMQCVGTDDRRQAAGPFDAWAVVPRETAGRSAVVSITASPAADLLVRRQEGPIAANRGDAQEVVWSCTERVSPGASWTRVDVETVA